MPRSREPTNNSFGFKGNVEAKATLRGELQAFQQSELIYCAVLAPSGVAALVVNGIWPSPFALGIAVFCFGVVGVMAISRVVKFFKAKEAAAPSAIDVRPDGGYAVSGPILNSGHVTLLIRTALLGRVDVPIPDGEVLDGKPESNQIRKYTEEEKAQIAAALPREIQEHDIQALGRATAALPDPAHQSGAALSQPGAPPLERLSPAPESPTNP